MNNQLITINLNYENNNFTVKNQMVKIYNNSDGEIVLKYNHMDFYGDGHLIKIGDKDYNGNFIYYINNNILNIYFE
jgi:hypothetical protein